MNASQLTALLERTAQGDQQAFATLYQVCSPKLNGIARLLMRDQDKANEVLHDAFLQIWQKAAEYRSDMAEPMTWMSSIVRFRALDLLRKQKRRLEGKFQEQDNTDIENLQATIAWQQEQVHSEHLPPGVRKCLDQLPDNQRDAIFFAYLFGHSREDIALIFTASVNTVKSWLHRGVRSLQQCLTN